MMRANRGMLMITDGHHGISQPGSQIGDDDDGQQDVGEGQDDVHDAHDQVVWPTLVVSGKGTQDRTAEESYAYADNAQGQ